MNVPKQKPLAHKWLAVCAAIVATAAVSSVAVAQQVYVGQIDATTSSNTNWFESIFSSGEYVAEETYVAQGDVRRGERSVRDITEHNTILRLVLTPKISVGILRLGFDWERFSFDMPHDAPLPDTLQAPSFVLGLDTQFTDSIVARFEAKPGFYGNNHLEWDSFNMPFIAGATYIYSPTLQFIAGVSVDVERNFPVIPAAGVRWKVHRLWVINGVLPTPRIEFALADNATLYMGANIKQVGYRMDDQFGFTHGNPNLNNAILTYTEVRTGIGIDWKLDPLITISAEAGYQPYRAFDFHRADVTFRETGSAPYGMISVHSAF
jgi:uncharacterized protein DUF6268